MTIWGALAGGVVGTIVLTSSLRIAQEIGWTRMDTPLLEPPGFMLMNYGRRTVLATLVAHVAYGAIVGGFAARVW